MFCQFPRNTCIRKQEIHSRKNRAVSAEALLQQLLLLLLVTLPFPSFTTNTTWKARKLFNNNRDAHENSHHFTMDLGYHVSDVPPSDGPLQIRTWSLGTFLQWKQQCHNDHQGQLVPMEHPVHRRGCANYQPRRYHQVPVEFHLPGRTRLHLFCDKVKRRQPQEQCANCNRLNSSWRFPQQNAIMREGERTWVKPWHCEEATGWGRWLLQVHFWFEELAVITSLRKDSKITEWFVIYSCCICPSQWFDITYETWKVFFTI